MKEDSIGKKAVKAGIGYTVGNIMIRGISFLTIPLFARLLTVSDYGIVNTFTAYTSIFLIIIGLALHSSLKNAYIDFQSNIKKYISSLVILPMICVGILLIIAVFFNNELTMLLKLEHQSFLVLILIDSYCLSLITYYNCVLALNYKYKEYMLFSLIYSILGIGLSVIYICTIFQNNRYLGRIWGTLSSAVIVAFLILFKLFKSAKPKINLNYWKYGLTISLPIVPHGLSQLLLSQFDRLMIKNIIGSTEAGLYSFAYTIACIYQVVSSSIDTVWTQWFFQEMKSENNKKIRVVSNYYVLLLAFGAILFMLISPELVVILGGNKYVETKTVILPIILSVYYAAMYNLPASIEYYYKKTNLIAVGTMIAASLNILLNVFFIPRYGYVAAAYTTVVCYFGYFIMHMYIAYRINGYALYDLKIFAICIFVVSLMMIVLQLFIDLLLVRMALLFSILLFAVFILVRNKDTLKQLSNE